MIIDTPRDVLSLRQLWKKAFGDTDAFLDGFFATGFALDRCRCLFQNEQLAGALYWFDCQWDGQKLAYLYAVATDPDFRGKGLCRALMEDTHRHLKTLGYAGTVLVPGNPGLFSLYKKLGYSPFCPMQTLTVASNNETAKLVKITPENYAERRRGSLPKGAVVQEIDALTFANTFCGFYAGETTLLCVAKEKNTLYFQEFLGDPAQLGSIVHALNGEKGVVRLPGGQSPYAMYHLFDDTTHIPTYFGIPLN